MKLCLPASTGACRHQNLLFQSKKSEKDKKIKTREYVTLVTAKQIKTREYVTHITTHFTISNLSTLH